MSESIDAFGELRAAIEATVKDRDQFGWVVFSLSLLEDERRQAGLEKVRRELGEELHNGATLLEWAEFASTGAPALSKRIEAEAPEVARPRWAAAMWLAAWAWQCAINKHDPPDGMHVCMGLGVDGLLMMQWDTSKSPAPRHVVITPGQIPAGKYNTHAALMGYPGLPDHLDISF